VQEIFGSAFAAQPPPKADRGVQASWLGAVDGLLKDAPASRVRWRW
jgi:hypothetical protein